MSPDFVPAIREAVAIYREVYGKTLVAVYVSGSIHRDEAVLGVSDLDLYPWVSASPSPATNERLRLLAKVRLAAWAPANMLKAARILDWLVGAQVETSAQERAVAWLRWCRAREMGEEVDDETQVWERYVGFASTLHYDATLIYGEHVLVGLPIPALDAALARMYMYPLLFAVRLACRGQESQDFPLPKEPWARLRKIARRAVRLGDLVLVAWGRPSSGRGVDILPVLTQAAPRWSAFLHDTARCYIRVEPDAPSYQQYLETLAEFAEWCWYEVIAASPLRIPPVS